MANIDILDFELGEARPEFELPVENISTSHALSLEELLVFGSDTVADSVFDTADDISQGLGFESSRLSLNKHPISRNTSYTDFSTTFNIESYQYKITDIRPNNILSLQYVKTITHQLTKPLTLVLALPRPRMLRRILETLAVLPIRELIITASDLSDPSFFLSHSFKQEGIRERLKYGVKQSGIPFCPKIRIIRGKELFFNKFLPILAGFKLLGDSESSFYSKDLLNVSDIQSNLILKSGLVLLIGPERGWSTKEKNKFMCEGVQNISLGPETYQVDTAIISLLSQLNLVFSIFNERIAL